MEGEPGVPGICYRTFDELFRVRDRRTATGRVKYTITVSMLEIYNEQVSSVIAEARRRFTAL
jgi:hypothetical protein